MKYKLILCILFTACVPKNDISKKQINVKPIANISSICPDGGQCELKILQNKCINLRQLQDSSTAFLYNVLALLKLTGTPIPLACISASKNNCSW